MICLSQISLSKSINGFSRNSFDGSYIMHCIRIWGLMCSAFFPERVGLRWGRVLSFLLHSPTNEKKRGSLQHARSFNISSVTLNAVYMCLNHWTPCWSLIYTPMDTIFLSYSSVSKLVNIKRATSSLGIIFVLPGTCSRSTSTIRGLPEIDKIRYKESLCYFI